MLAGIADQKHAVIGSNPREKLAHLVGAGKARFIHKVEVLSLSRVWIRGAGAKALEGSRVDASLIQLACRAGGWGEALNLIALPFHGTADGCERGRLA